MQALERDSVDELLEEPILEIANTVSDDDAPFNAIIGLLLGLLVSLPLWAAVGVAVFLILR
jgi:hypothetical protein